MIGGGISLLALSLAAAIIIEKGFMLSEVDRGR
jgi:hypothetical protein